MSGGPKFGRGDVPVILVLLVMAGVIVFGGIMAHIGGRQAQQLEEENAALKEERANLRRTREAYMRCRREGRVPVMGWSFDVVCLDKDAVRWEYSNKPQP